MLADELENPMFYPTSVGNAPNPHGTLLNFIFCLVFFHMLSGFLWLR
jgi:hypothetical protein